MRNAINLLFIFLFIFPFCDVLSRKCYVVSDPDNSKDKAFNGYKDNFLENEKSLMQIRGYNASYEPCLIIKDYSEISASESEDLFILHLDHGNSVENKVGDEKYRNIIKSINSLSKKNNVALVVESCYSGDLLASYIKKNKPNDKLCIIASSGFNTVAWSHKNLMMSNAWGNTDNVKNNYSDKALDLAALSRDGSNDAMASDVWTSSRGEKLLECSEALTRFKKNLCQKEVVSFFNEIKSICPGFYNNDSEMKAWHDLYQIYSQDAIHGDARIFSAHDSICKDTKAKPKEYNLDTNGFLKKLLDEINNRKNDKPKNNNKIFIDMFMGTVNSCESAQSVGTIAGFGMVPETAIFMTLSPWKRIGMCLSESSQIIPRANSCEKMRTLYFRRHNKSTASVVVPSPEKSGQQKAASR